MTIEIAQLCFSYGRGGSGLALTEISATALPGRITAVVGPNAAGKSTLLRCIIGSLSPTKGSVLIDGIPVHRMKTRRLAHTVAYVPQRPTVSAAFTVRQVVELGRHALPPSNKRIDDALRATDLLHEVDRLYAQLSVGQQQRASLARALAQLESPPHGSHLVLDEPTSALDLQHISQCMRLLRNIADAGSAIIWAVHDLRLAVAHADDCWLMDAGRLVAAGPVDRVLTQENIARVFRVNNEEANFWASKGG
jgi:iron complex transport system ATP-binding protein